ncbi:MAG: UvrD-helicase domain-containing protein, partial [Actinomycetota bacterium]|nr:UvrD-helicase domain-containing protein [Actinomycetota bacterium]
METDSAPSTSDTVESAPTDAPTTGLFDIAGMSAEHEMQDAAAERRDLASALRRSYTRQLNYQAAALSEPLTAAALQPLSDQGWRVMHDRRWPGTSRANVDHLVIGHNGVAVIDTKHWSLPVQVRDDRLWCGDDDRHDDTVDTILRLTASIEELLEEVMTSSPGRAVGLSPIHVVPVLVFTGHPYANRFAPRIGRVLMSTIRSLPSLLARRPRVLDDAQIALIGEYLAREMPPALVPNPVSPQRRASLAVPIRARPAPRPAPTPQPEQADQLFDVAELADQLTRAATRPMRDWMGFLHPSQARLVKRCFNGPARVRGPAGTGKTVVLLHRAAWLATIRPGRILVTTFVRTLPGQLGNVYRQLSPDTADKVDFLAIHGLARNVLAINNQHLTVCQRLVDRAFTDAWTRAGANTALADLRPAHYWREEIDHVIKGRGLCEVADYEAVERRGRTLPLTDTHKHLVWDLLHTYQEHLDRAGTYDNNDVLSAALNAAIHHPPQPGWSAVLVDEVQDLNLLGIRLCRELAGDGTDALFLVGDGQQALYPGGFTLAEARVSVTGRAVVLRTNYRNTRQILDSAQQLVADRDFTDLDSTTEHGTRDVEVLRDGPPVRHEHAPHRHGLALLLRQAMRTDAATGILWGDMAVLCHTRAHVDDVTRRLTTLGIPLCRLADWDGQPDDRVKIGTIHRCKGLDFAAVYLPDLRAPRNPHTPDAATEPSDWAVQRAQREYVARTRPRDLLWIGTI